MADDRLSASRLIPASADVVFAVLADPAEHAAIDGTGWVCEPVDAASLTAVGQIFRMAMFHPRHPDGGYEVANRIEVLDRPCAIAWATGYDPGGGNLTFGGWFWRYDLAEGPDGTEVTLSYDWSACSASVRETISFPPFGPEHLLNSLDHLAEMVTRRLAGR